MQRRKGTGEVRFAAAKNKRTEEQMILVDKAEVGKTRRQIGAGYCDDAVDFNLQQAREGFEIFMPTSVALGPTAFSECDATHFGCARHAAANSRSNAPHSGRSSSQ